jgi:hypothetical protein
MNKVTYIRPEAVAPNEKPARISSPADNLDETDAPILISDLCSLKEDCDEDP